MITLAIFAALILGIFIVFLVSAYLETENWGTTVFAFFIALVINAILFGLFLLVSDGISGASKNTVTVSQETHSLRALDTGSSGSGSFFLGSGNFEEGPAYTYILRGDDGSFSLESIDADEAKVFETTDGSEPKMVVRWVVPKSRLWSVIATTEKVEFYVPAGSVQEPTYNVSTEK